VQAASSEPAFVLDRRFIEATKQLSARFKVPSRQYG